MNYKKGFIIVGILVIIIIFLLVAKNVFYTPSISSNINTFYYSSGSSSVGVTYTIENKNSKYTITEIFYNGNTQKKKIKKITNSLYLTQLENILEKYHANNWNHFHDSSFSTGGSATSLEVKYKNGRSIQAHMEKNHPEGFIEASHELEKLLHSMVSIWGDQEYI